MTNDGNYQDTFCDWVGEIPKDWNMTRGRFLFKSKKEINRELQCKNLLSLTLNGVLNKDYQSSEGLRPENYNTYQIFQKDDLVFKMIDLENIRTSRVGLVHEEGIMSPVYIRHEPIKEKINPKFAYWFYYDLYKKEIYNSIGSGVRSSLSSSDLLEIELPVPPIIEQKLISRYLNKKTSQIDLLVEKIKKKIELLKEQRNSLINHYVTKGLDQNVEMKDSGVEWIGEMPKHWEVTPMFCLFSENKVKNKDGRLDVLTLSYGKIKYRDLSKLEGLLPESFDGYQVMESQSIIIRSTDLQNDHKSLRVGHVGINGVITSAYLGLNPIKNMDTKFYYYSIHLADLKKVLYGLGGGLRQSLRFDDFKRFPILNPPQKEREEISGKLDNIDRKVNNLVSKLEKRVGLLNEYRQSIISSVVTGKVRVTEDMI
jgi:type I restriction enzyme S subunit